MWRAFVTALVFVTLLLPRGPALLGAVRCQGHHTVHAAPCCPEAPSAEKDGHPGSDHGKCCVIVNLDPHDQGAVPVPPPLPAVRVPQPPRIAQAWSTSTSPAPVARRWWSAPPAIGPPPEPRAADVWLEQRSLRL